MNHVQNGKSWGAGAAGAISLLCATAYRALFVDASFLDFAPSECEEQAALRCRLPACAPQSEGIGTKTKAIVFIS